MAYSKTNWQNLPNTTTPVNATNLNKIEDGLFDMVKVLSLSNTSANITIGDIGIEWGESSITSDNDGSMAGDLRVYNGTTQITFNRTYKNNPVVIPIWRGSYINQLSIASYSIAKTGCYIRGYLLTPNSERNIKYLVIGAIN